MVFPRSCCLLGVVLAMVLCSPVLGRDWTIGGRVYDAELDQLSDDGNTVYFYTKDGMRWQADFSQFSAADQTYLRQWREAQLAAPPAPAPAEAAAPSASRSMAEPSKSSLTPRSWSQGRRRALLIGVTDYTDLATLDLAVPDIVALREKLLATGFATEDTVCMTTEERESRLRPTKRMLDRQLDATVNDSFFSQVKQGDLVLIAMSGHGVEIDGVPYFCPSDAAPADKNTMVSIEGIMEKLEKSPAAYKIVLIDACRERFNPNTGRAIGDGARGIGHFARSVVDVGEARGVVFLQSCAEGQISWENSKLGHGVFMYHLLQGLGGKADENGNKDGVIQLLELYQFAAEGTKNYTRNLPGAELQTPVLKGEFTDFDLTDAITERKLARFTVRIDHANGAAGKDLPVQVVRQDAFKPKEEPEVLAVGRTNAQGELELPIPTDRVGVTDKLIARIAYLGDVVSQDLIDLNERPHQILIATKVVPPPTQIQAAGDASVAMSQPPEPPPQPRQIFTPSSGWTSLGTIPGTSVQVFRDNMTGLEWTQTLGSVASNQNGGPAHALVARYGFRLPSFDELATLSSHGGLRQLGMRVPAGYETADPGTLANTAGGYIRRPQPRLGIGQNYVVGVRNWTGND